MADGEEIGERAGLAAEYALGTLSLAERAAAEQLLAADPDFAQEVMAWQSRLGALASTVPPVEPSAGLWQRIVARIDGASANGQSAAVLLLQQRVRRWRAATWATGAIAAGLAAMLLASRYVVPQGRPAGSFVAVLQSEGKSPAFVAAVDLANGTIAIRRVGAERLANRVYELWAVGGDREKPQSLGVIDAGGEIPVNRLGRLDSGLLSQTVFAISEEPIGGSPTGQPTGPVVFTGKLLPISAK